jgi:hypothetical protein
MRRLAGGACATLLANPVAFAVAGTCLWLLTQVVVGVVRARAEGVDWGVSDVVSCGVCMLALLVLAGLALGHITLTAIVGWRGKS